MLIRCAVDDVYVEVDDDTPSQSLEAFESILARVAGTAISLYRDTARFDESETEEVILFKPDFDGTDEDA